MKVGHGSAPIELVDGEPMGGYIARAGGLSGRLDPLEVHALSFADDHARFVHLVVDVVCVNIDLVALIRERCTRHAITVWVSATHTHSAPESGCRPGGDATPPSVARRIVAAAETAVAAALADEQEAFLHVVRARTAEVASRRTGPDPHAVDLPVDAVRVHDARTDALRGVLVVTPVHPTVLAADNTRASADLSGAIRRVATRRWGGWAVAATGAAGDISTRGARRARDADELVRIAEVVVDALDHGVDDATRGSGPIAHGSASGVLSPNTLDADALAPDAVDHALDADAESSRWREVYEQGRRALIELGGRHGAEPVPIVIEAVAVGPVRFVGIPGEPFLELGERIHGATGAIVLGCTNGYLGYLPVPGTPVTYETIISPVDATSTDEVVRLGIAATQRVDPDAVASSAADAVGRP